MIQKIRAILFRNSGNLFFWSIAILSIIVSFLIIYFKIRPTSEPMALHYNVIVGVDALGPGTHLYRIPLIGLIVLVVNILFSRFGKGASQSLVLLAGITSAVVAVILLCAVLFLLKIA